MQQFIDEITLSVSSGHGGPGRVSFLHEKYAPRGGPDGGDGGRGGDLLVRVRQDLRTLIHLTRNREIRAEDGGAGGKKDKHGRDGHDAVIEVPPGTVLIDNATGEVLMDAVVKGTEVVLLKGGRGGKGNAHFATSRNQAPRFAQDGEPGSALSLRVELRLIADIGFVGKPNAGKSSLLGRLTAAHPKIGSYPFTTRIPNLGVLQLEDETVVLADIPGLIEGASDGAGLGYTFLKHISRTTILAFVLDLGDPEPLETLGVLEHELASYSDALKDRPKIVVGNKIDLPDATGRLEELRAALPDVTVLGVSALTGDGIRSVAGEFIRASRAGNEGDD